VFESLPSTPFCIGGKVIEFLDSWPHLRHVLNVNGDDGMEINKIRKALCGQINQLNGQSLFYFGNLTPVLKLRLIKLFCCSLYGSVLWDLDHSNIDALCCTWRTGLRRVWNISYRTHCNILPLLPNALMTILLFNSTDNSNDNSTVLLFYCSTVFESLPSATLLPVGSRKICLSLR